MVKSRRLNVFKAAARPVLSGPGGTVELLVDGLSHDGRGVARAEKKVVFVADALPGERVSARILRRQKRYDEAELLHCLTPSPERVTPFCEVYAQCGGCQLQHLSIDAQRRHKSQRLMAALTGLPAVEQELAAPEVFSSTDQAYRHRARLSYRAGHLGFKAKASHRVVAFSQCPVLMAPLNQALAAHRPALLAYLRRGSDAELLLACDQNDRLALRIQQSAPINTRHCQALATALGDSLVLHSVQSSAGQQWQAPEPRPPLQYPLPGGDSLAFFPADFTQVNPVINGMMVQQVLAWLAPTKGETIVDLFCGLGNFSRALALAGARVVAVDAGSEMIASAQRQACDSGLDIHYHCADLFAAAPFALPPEARKLVLDPPRAGAKQLCETLAAGTAVAEIVYVSCDPASLRRDLQLLQRGGFQLAGAVAADMFPHSYHLESLVYLRRNSARGASDAGPTTPQI